MNSKERAIYSKLSKAKPYDFPGLKLSAIYRGKKIIDMDFGKTWEHYDLASLTKILFTTSWFMKTHQKNKKFISQKVKDILPWYKHKDVAIHQLLSHSAGYEWWRPFYKFINIQNSPNEKYAELMWEVRKIPLTHKGRKAIYSDIDFFFLGALMEKVENQPLLQVWNEFQQRNFPKLGFHFNYENKSKFRKGLYAPTEKCPWRKKILQGEVHDDNTWALGGVAPHAGLFGTMKDMLQWGMLVRSSLKGQRSFISRSVLRTFTKRSMPASKGDWALGFMVRSAKKSTAGTLFSPESFGHVGFTGTSFWMDPKKDLIVNILSNRVHKTRKNKDFNELRPQIHDWVIEAIEG